MDSGEHIDGRRLARAIDLTELRPVAGWEEIEPLCRQAARYGFAAVCVHPVWVAAATVRLDELGAQVPVCAVAGFPLGSTLPAVKAEEAAACVRAGAREVDMVLNVAWLKGGRTGDVRDEIARVAAAVKGPSAGNLLKVIIEACYLEEDEKRRACDLIAATGADFVKTSTGFGSGGATVEDVRLLRRVVAGRLRIKAAGGIRDAATARAMVEAGADRIGASGGVAIVNEAGYVLPADG